MTDETKTPNAPTQPQDIRSRPDAGRGNDDRSNQRGSNPKLTDPKLPDLSDDPDDTSEKVEPQGAARGEGGRNPSLERTGSDPSRSRDDEARGGGRNDERGQSGGANRPMPKPEAAGTGKKPESTPSRDGERR